MPQYKKDMGSGLGEGGGSQPPLQVHNCPHPTSPQDGKRAEILGNFPQALIHWGGTEVGGGDLQFLPITFL